MNITVLMSEVYPLPAVRGGAVETLVNHWLDSHEDAPDRVNLAVVSRYSYEAKNRSRVYTNTVFHWVVPLPFGRFWVRFRRKVFPNAPVYPLYLNFAMRKICRTAPDLIIIENRPEFVLAVRLRFPKTRIVLHLHNDTLNEENKLGTQIVHALDQILCVSAFIQKRVLTIVGVTPEKLAVLPNVVNLNQFSFQTRLLSERPILAFLGRLSLFKGVTVLAKTFLRLKESLPQLHLWFAGSSGYRGSREDQTIRSLKKSLSQYSDSVKFFGFVPQNSLVGLLRQASVLVVPSLWDEPAGLTVLEGMALGIPTVASRRGGIPEYLSEKEGWLYDSDSEAQAIDELEKVLTFVLTHFENALKKADLARTTVEQKFSAQDYWSRLLGVLEIG
ncbi:MAG: glycosyltransferase family 4 protein [Spirochaetales bacterium]|nr:glycosyltransferase family 4 protein [Spirochaetales bacterium]